ncbi:phosphodiesterase, MJ0936 family protein [Lapidilactobacillus concavus DSM 17758]|uniref:Phosphoesterase n=1 Tax=Lapidilactobacillus concavus DSM 17758 TaxID=1423735 RepID=A0A0R1W4I7_9LACO|nr:metallophosphoesterase [Lapidilactobacillus concavus]KRM10262.1 phosphodiesterase, MJ0936 family protein [Lapidilactobacillus concavus DSM 17758]GEL13346.1 phosphoesterase [Lapidilactobacillus concavus]
MRALVVSDSHGDDAILQQLVARYQHQVDVMIHCGDSELSDQDPLRQQFLIVQGNMDFDQQFPLQIVTQVAGESVLIVHGHRVGVNMGLDRLSLLAQEQQAQFVCYGHTHQLACEFVDGRLFLNPGSISQPRGEYIGLHGTYAIVESTPETINVQYYQRHFEPVDTLALSFKR